MELLERESLLASLHDFQAEAAGAAGSLVFVSGEAGIGKTALLRRFCDGLPEAFAVHWGFCDSLGTPRALGPLYDIARTGLHDLAGLLADGQDRHTLFTAFLDLIGAAPSVTVIEDAHWADEATLDLLLFAGRRIGALPAMIVVTYRSEDVGRDHPLRRILGDLATATSVRRLTVPALSRSAVAALAERAGRDGVQLHQVTGGNAFFVTEALTVSAQQLPPTVRDAVLARASRLGRTTRALVDVVALVPDRVEVSLLRSVIEADGVESAMTALDEGVRSGMLVLDGLTVRFRHDLARRAVEADVPAARATVLHGRVLAYLAGTADTTDAVDPARLAYHADAAGDSAAVLRYAPAAAAVAAGLGAHRQAAAHYGVALRHADGASAQQRAQLWQHRADAYNRGGDLTAAIDAATHAIQLWHAAGAVEDEAAVMARRCHMLWSSGRTVEAHESAQAAVALLEPLPPGPVLAQASAALAQMLMLAGDIPGALELGSAAISYAEQFHDDRALAWALNTVGAAHWSSDPDRAVELLTASLNASQRAGDHLAAAAAMNSLGSGATETRRYDLAHQWLGQAVAFCAERDMDPPRGYAVAWQSRCLFEQGRWVDADNKLTDVLGTHSHHMPTRIVALTVLGRLRARRGDQDVSPPLQLAWALAQQTGDLRRLWPAAAARAESAWLSGAPTRIEALVADTHRLAIRAEDGWAADELGYWRWIAGTPADHTTPAARPYALQVSGNWKAAATLWLEYGCPYEAALALADSNDPEKQLTALRDLQRLGAWPAAEIVAHRLREHGIRRLPRPPRRTTLNNPAQLTARQVDVLDLLARGLQNAEIAARLHISPRTVDHHVSAILAKLGVDSRQKAAQWEAARRAAPGMR